MKRLLESAQQKVENFTTPVSKHLALRSRSPRPTSRNHELDHQADRSSTPTPTAPTSDDSAGRSNSVAPNILVETQAGAPDINDDKQPVPTIVVDESHTFSVPASIPSKKFVEVKTKNAQHDLVVLHVAYTLQKSSSLKGLIIEIVKLNKEPGFEDIVQVCVGFTTRLIAGLDSPTETQVDVKPAIETFLKTVQTVGLNDPRKTLDEIKSSIKEIEIDHPDIPKIEKKKDSGNFSKLIRDVLGVALPMLEIIKTGTSMIPVPMVQPLIGVVAGLLQAADQACNNFEWMRWLSTTAAECVIGIAVRCPEQMERQWTDAIETLRTKLSDIVQQAEDYCQQSVASRFLHQGRDKGAIEMMKENLKVVIISFNTQVGMEIKLDLKRMSRQIEELSLSTLPRLPFDRFSQDDRVQVNRKKEIKDTLQWIESSDGIRFFWIHGAAGIGKSTLAHCLLDLVKGEGILGTFAYFSIGNDIDPQELVRMMARELYSLHPGCQHEVARAIRECAGTHESLEVYLTNFLVKPVVSLKYASSLVIILDALDEWAHREIFLKALHKVIPLALSLKFIMTSRHPPEPKSIVPGSATLYKLTTVSPTICRKYFEERFNDLTWDGPAPNEERLGKLVQLADGLLIWAATVCKLVSTEHSNKGPHDILDEILLSSSIVSHEDRMDDLYREALKRIFPATDDGSRLRLLRSMVALREALPLIQFARLVNMRPKYIQTFCSYLTALQTRGTFDDATVQPAVNLFHASFIEHLGGVDEAHGVMADNCIRFFKQVTGPDVANGSGPRQFQKAEQYIGEHWMYHLREAPLEKRLNLFSNIPSNHLCLRDGCLLSHLQLAEDEYGCGPGSNLLKTTPDALAYLPDYFNDLGIWYSSCFRRTDDPHDIDRAISCYKNAVKSTPSNHVCLQNRFNSLGSSYLSRFRRTGNLQDIRWARTYHQKAIDSTPSGDADHPGYFNNLGNSYLFLFECTGALQDIDRAVSHHQRAVDSTPSGHSNLPSFLNDLGNSYLGRFKRTGDPQDINHAISYHQKAVESTPSDHAVPPSRFNGLGSSYLSRFRHTGNLQDIHQAITHHQKAIDSTPSGDADLPGYFNNLGSSYLCRFKRTGDLQDIDWAISHHQRAVDSTPSGHSNLLSFFNNLGNSYLGRFERTGDPEDVECAISHHQRAVGFTPSGHDNLLILFNNLENSHSRRFECTSDLRVIECKKKAYFSPIWGTHLQKTVECTSSYHANLPSLFNSLGNSHSHRFELTSDLQDIERTISHLQRAVGSTPSCYANLLSLFNSLGNSCSHRFERTSDLQDIERTISHFQRAVGSTPSCYANLPSLFNNLGNSYLDRFEYTSGLRDIDWAISHLQGSTPCHANLPSLFDNLGNLYLGRFEHTSDLRNIDWAISYLQKAVGSTPSGHADLPSFFDNLGNLYLGRFDRTGDFQDIERAISHLQKAVESTHSCHANLPSLFNNLGSSYLHRFKRTGDLQDIECAISYHQRAVESTPSGHADLPSLFNNLGNSYSHRFDRTDDLQDIECAISHLQKAVESTPSGHGYLPKLFNSLGNLYSHRFDSTHSSTDLQQSIASYRRGADANGASSLRLTSAKNAAMLSSSHRYPQCLDDFSLAITLLSEVAGLEQIIHRRHTNIHVHSNLVESAVATALEFDRPDLALEWLEQGHCLAWNQLNQLRTPIDHLRIENPALANNFIKVASALESDGTRPVLSNPSRITLAGDICRQDAIHNHTIHTAEYRQFLEPIRGLPNDSDFLRPPKSTSLLASLPPDGPVVIFNIHKTRCDALVLIAGADKPVHIHLENFSLEQAEKLHKIFQFDVLNSREGVDKERSVIIIDNTPAPVSFVLTELWNKVVQPIFEAIAYFEPPDISNRTRMWWCPTGPLAFLPLHAAGIYGSAYRPGLCVSDYVVSSYTPNVRFINDKFAASPAPPKSHKLLLISQPNTPGLRPISAARKETHILEDLMKGTTVDVLLLEDAEATTKRVKQEMDTHSWVHFACRGIQDMDDPLKSGVHLYNGRLELLEIMRQKISNPELAFLSARQTSEGDVKLSKEVVHLAAGMLAAGYRGVVGTMWSISGMHAAKFATEFYRYLLEDEGSEGLDSTRAAFALDYATRKVRETLGEGDVAFLTWVPYVHFGY